MRSFTRRDCMRLAAGAGLLAGTSSANAQRSGPAGRSTVALIHGDDRRRIVRDSLEAIKDQIKPSLMAKDRVVIKPNDVSTRNPLASSNADALRGILDFLEPFGKPVVIAESSAGNTRDAYEEFGYDRLPAEYRRLNVQLVDLNDEGLYEVLHILDGDLHPVPVRLAKRLLDPDAYTICAGIMKTHNTVVATLSVKNMTLGAPLRSGPKEAQNWNDKRHYHGGVRQTNYDIMLTAQKLKPFWGATVIDGFEGMEGNGPGSGTPVDSRIAIASTDYIAADRVGVECMGIDPSWVGYLNYCHDVGVGQYDLSQIDILGAKLADVRREYVLHRDIDRELQWMGPMNELPPKLG